MFTGIIQKKATIASIEERDSNRLVQIRAPRWKLPLGASIAVDGICSTVVRAGRGIISVEYMPETLQRSTAKSFTRGCVVNLERSLVYGAPIDGHFVQGHVDGEGVITKVFSRARAHEITIRIPRALTQFVASKGSISVNGVALTVARVHGPLAMVALVPYTISHTNLGGLVKGNRVNIEVDLIAKYLALLARK